MRRKRDVSQPKIGCVSSVTASVPQNSDGRFDTPDVMPIVSRTGRRIMYAVNAQKM